MSIYTKSPRSVATRRFPSDANVPVAPKLSDSCNHKQQQQTRVVTNQDLRRLSKFVSLWKLHALTHKNNRRKRCQSRPRSRAVLLNMRKNQNKSFDPESCVLSLSSNNYPTLPKDNEEIPWYEQEEEILPWWEYPDLDEEDESTLMVRQITTQKDHVYVNRVESLVWTAIIKLQNVAQFALAQKLQRKQKQAPTVPVRSRSPSPSRLNSSRGQPHARVTVPTMFMGLPKEVQAEKRRFRKAREAHSEDTLEPPPTTATVKKATELAKLVTPAPAPKRIITRKPAPLVEYETPTAWTRTSAPVAPTKTRPRRTRSNAIDASVLLAKPTPTVPPTPTNARPRRMRSSTIANTAANTSKPTATTMNTTIQGAPIGSVNRRIQALKLKQQSLKAQAERQAQQAAETDAVQQRLEAQQKRLARVRQQKK